MATRTMGQKGLARRLEALVQESSAGEACLVIEEGTQHRLSAGARLGPAGHPEFFVEVVLGASRTSAPIPVFTSETA